MRASKLAGRGREFVCGRADGRGLRNQRPRLGGSLARLSTTTGAGVGNIVGSNIANICLILGVAALICPIPVRTSLVRREVIR